MKYFIGLDGGTQSTKVFIFDLQGNIVCQARQELQPLNMPEHGVAEHPDDDLWHSTVSACRSAMTKFPHNPQLIHGIGVCTIRCCRALLKADGSLAAPVLNWMDQRLSQPYSGGNPEVRYVTTSSGYITHRLTGHFKDTASNYEGMWPIDKNHWQWSTDPEVLANFNIPADQLFELAMPGEIVGNVTSAAAEQTGLPAGLPVIATANDKAVEALGAGLPQLANGESTALISLGTYICGMVYGDSNEVNAKHYFSNMSSIPGRYLHESGGIRNGMGTVSWFKDLLGPQLIAQSSLADTSAEEILNCEAEQVPVGADGLMTVPEWLAPPDKPFKRGVMIGFRSTHTRAHIYRSILEAIALTMNNHVDAMRNELGFGLRRIIVSGGGTNSDLFMQIIADVFGIPAERPAVRDAAALGAAICVAVAVDAYGDFDEAIDNMVSFAGGFTPVNANTQTYDEINTSVYLDITTLTDKILSKSHTFS
ncbi:MAG: sugar kinase [Arenicella sp.]|nr:sugar kinase [Arenicella sp.]